MAEELPKEPSPEDIERDIENLLETLNGEEYSDMWYDFPELQEEWYWVEQEARVAVDRVTAKKTFGGFY